MNVIPLHGIVQDQNQALTSSEMGNSDGGVPNV